MIEHQLKSSIDTAKISQRLFTIRNIANLAVLCPDTNAEAYVLQDILDHISELVQNIIEEIDD
jgi:hypothetical protein